jgi:hypothetical protein
MEATCIGRYLSVDGAESKLPFDETDVWMI